MTSHQYEIIERLPTVMEYNFLWHSVGWGEVNAEITKMPNPYKSQQSLNSVHGKDQ
ncbi:hypothetical protein SAMN04487895_105236 [Paenibacillus sophorae]|uniref:Uncharacterized protein n=1 Tax=Paenibacillus sophorae TaxID=1333845 RepID=A0A1H8MHM2_9BACL|nr:hypothetical protein SAMN04487895_105236 [Paenibacillus sophorae]